MEACIVRHDRGLPGLQSLVHCEHAQLPFSAHQPAYSLPSLPVRMRGKIIRKHWQEKKVLKGDSPASRNSSHNQKQITVSRQEDTPLGGIKRILNTSEATAGDGGHGVEENFGVNAWGSQGERDHDAICGRHRRQTSVPARRGSNRLLSSRCST